MMFHCRSQSFAAKCEAAVLGGFMWRRPRTRLSSHYLILKETNVFFVVVIIKKTEVVNSLLPLSQSKKKAEAGNDAVFRCLRWTER